MSLKSRFFLLLPPSLAATLLLLAGRPLRSQQEPTFTAEVKVVNVLATVRNKKGEVVRDLSQDDFVLEDDGKPQTVKYFARDTDLPLTLGLLVDTSGSERRMIGEERTASRAFLEQVLREDKDAAFLIHFDREVELLQDLTSSRQKLESALNQLETPELNRAGTRDPSAGTQRGRRFGGGTTLYDAVYLASNELMKKQQGRKALVVLSDGVDTGSRETLENAIEAAQRADTLVYSILIADEAFRNPGGYGGGGGGPHVGMGGGWPGGGWPGGGGGWPGGGRRGGGSPRPQTGEPLPEGKKILQRISQETGGRMFEVSKKQTVEQIYSQIEEELRSQYNLGFTPDQAGASPGYHKLHLAAKKKDLQVQAREGYYAGP